MQVAVIGSGDEISDSLVADIEAFGKFCAENNYIVICGGKGGVMRAISKGVRESGGTVVCILPEDKAYYANEYCSVVIPTGMGLARNVLVINAADIIIAFAGSFGTLSEMAIAIQKQKPIIFTKWTGGFSQSFGEAISEIDINDIEEGKVNLFSVDNIEQLKELVKKLERRGV